MSSNLLTAWQQEVRAGQESEKASSLTEALGHYQKALQLDDQYADLHYRLGRVCLKLNRTEEGVKFFNQARNLDVLHFRTDTRMNQIIRNTARSLEGHGVKLVESEQAIAARSPNGLAGDELFYDHVHFTFEGNYWLGLAFAERAEAAIPKGLLF